MRRSVIWGAAVVVLVALPAVIGLVAIRGGDDGSSARRAAALVQEGSASAAYQLAVNGITQTGEVIDVNAYSWGVKGAPAATAGTSTGRAQFGNLEITKKLDETSPLFVKAAAQGQNLPSAVLTLFQAGGGPDYAKYTLTNVHVDNVQHGGNADNIPTEQISLTYGKLTVEVASIEASGKLGNKTMFSYDVAAAKS
jgi:type VI secretion system secreted protein Hcp